MSKITVRPGADRDREFWRLIAGQGQQDHKLLWQLFSDGPERKRDFIFRRLDSGRGTPGYLAVSVRQPLAGSLWRSQTKPYLPKLRRGQRLSFSLRANPVISRRDESGKQHRHDVVMDRKKKLEAEQVPCDQWPSQAALVQEAGVQWLAGRAAKCGFSLVEGQVRVEGYHQVRFRKGRRTVSLASLDLAGLLEVADPERFIDTLYNGIGPAKGYGFGLMLVRPA